MSDPGSEIPEVIRRAIMAQGDYKVEEIEEALATVDLSDAPPPEPPSDEQIALELGVPIYRDRDR